MDSTTAAAAAGATHVGRVRDRNEDAYGITDRVWAVADGMGGHVGGDVASKAALDAAVRLLAATQAPGGDCAGQAVTTAFRAAHEAILALADKRPALMDMGTTLVLAWRADGGDVHLGNVGDSRAYLFAGGGLRQLTVDDNHAQELVDRGELTPDQARVHPGQYLLSKALGLGEAQAPEPRLGVVPPSGGRLLLCSDGLNGELDDATIAGLLPGGAPADAARGLVQAALDAGGNDNVTAVVVDLPDKRTG